MGMRGIELHSATFDSFVQRFCWNPTGNARWWGEGMAEVSEVWDGSVERVQSQCDCCLPTEFVLTMQLDESTLANAQ